ncbi:DUF4190 domain-containing protein [Candidatus Woesearchaeota archaeon]|nr:DUF4190 domain-containing protein [Candidatus Woesearchaeota archaeon]
MAKEKRAVPALVLGILSIPFALFPLLGLPIAIIALVLSVRGIKNQEKLAMAALICSIIGLVLVVANAAIGAYMGATGQHPLVNKLLGYDF